MLSQSVCLPFSIPNLYEGFAQAHGIVKASEVGLTLEFEVKDGLLGVLRSGVKEVQIPIDEIASVDLSFFWFLTRLVIKTRSMALLSKVPQSKAGQVALWSMGPKNREIAQRLVSDLRLRMTEKEAERLNQVIHQLGDACM